MHRRSFILSVPIVTAAALTIQRVAAQPTDLGPGPADLRSAERMREAATAFLNSLSDEQRTTTLFPLNANQRTVWSNLPVGLVPRVGVALGALGQEAKKRAHALMRASTSSQGYLKMTALMRHDSALHDLENGALKSDPNPRPGRQAIVDSMGVQDYWFAVFGNPAHDARWGWLITGHHLGATFTVAESRVTFTPLFVGAAPVEIDTGEYAGFKALSHEAIRGFELLRSLSSSQRQIAVQDKSFNDVVAGVGRQESLTRYEGIAASAFDRGQQTMLWELVNEYVRNADFSPADRQIAAIKSAGLDKLYFSWRGPVDGPESQFYYRIHGPRILIEYADQGGNHVHTITRDPSNDYGTDWLGLHYQEHAHG